MFDTIKFLILCVFSQIIIFILNKNKEYKFFINAVIFEVILIYLLHIIYILNTHLDQIYKTFYQIEKDLNTHCIAYNLMPDELFVNTIYTM
jgi:hypothetical protein